MDPEAADAHGAERREIGRNPIGVGHGHNGKPRARRFNLRTNAPYTSHGQTGDEVGAGGLVFEQGADPPCVRITAGVFKLRYGKGNVIKRLDECGRVIAGRGKRDCPH